MEPEHENLGGSSAGQGAQPEHDHSHDHGHDYDHGHDHSHEHEYDDSEPFRQEDIQEEVELEGDEPMSDEEDDGQRPEGEQIEFKDTSIAAFQGHGEKSLFTVSLHPSFPQPPLAISGGEDDAGYIWSTFDGEPLVRLGGHTDSVVAAGFSADGKFAATGGMDGQVRVWKLLGEAEDGRWTFAHSFTGPDEVVWIAWHPSAPIIAAGATDSTVWMWHVARGAHMGTFVGHTDAVTCGGWTPDGRRLVTASEDGSLIVWNPQVQSALAKLQDGDPRFHLPGGITSLRVAPDSGTVIVGSATGEIRIVNLARADVEGILTVVAALEGHTSGESVESIQFVHLNLVPGGVPATAPASGVLTGASDGQVHVWELATGKPRTTVTHDDSITAIAVHGTTPLFTTSAMDGQLRTWDARSGELLAQHQGFTQGVLSVAVGPDDGLTQGAETGGIGAYAQPGNGWKIVAGGDEGVGLVFRY